jgi:chromosome segregation ATPase
MAPKEKAKGKEPKGKGKPPSDKELLQQAKADVQDLKTQLEELKAKNAADLDALKKDGEDKAAAHAEELTALRDEHDTSKRELSNRLASASSSAKNEAEMEEELSRQLNISIGQFRREHRRAAHFESLYTKALADQKVSRADEAAVELYQKALRTAQQSQEKALSTLIVRRDQKMAAARTLNDTISRVGSLLEGINSLNTTGGS